MGDNTRRDRQGDDPALRKGRGAFFTPPDIARFLVDWAIRAPTDRVLEPSCGEAAFLTPAAARLGLLGASGSGQLHGVDVHRESVAAACRGAADRGCAGTRDRARQVPTRRVVRVVMIALVLTPMFALAHVAARTHRSPARRAICPRSRRLIDAPSARRPLLALLGRTQVALLGRTKVAMLG